MTVRELKNILKDVDDDLEVLVPIDLCRFGRTNISVITAVREDGCWYDDLDETHPDFHGAFHKVVVVDSIDQL